MPIDSSHLSHNSLQSPLLTAASEGERLLYLLLGNTGRLRVQNIQWHKK
jgi:hypothetical protein